jgi:hypothetical protein
VIRKPLRFWSKARSEAKTQQGLSFAQQKFFAPCLKSLVLSEVAEPRKAKEDVPTWGSAQ